MITIRSAAASAALALAVACGGSDDAQVGGTTTEPSGADATATTATTGQPATTPGAAARPDGPATVAVGEAAPVGDCCAMTVHAVTNPYPADQLGPLFEPGPGERAIGVDVEFAVHAGEPVQLALSDLTVRDDAGSFNSFDTVVGGGQIQNLVEPGTPFRGTLVYTVDDAATGLRLALNPLTAPEPLATISLG